jgi:ATP-dependent DNA helicase PIF1
MNPGVPPLRKRRSNMTEFDAPKRQKAESPATGNVIVITDSEDDDDNDDTEDDSDDNDDDEEIQSHANRNPEFSNREMPGPALAQPPITPPVPPSAKSPPLDHLGRPLSDAAFAVAREYWDCQRKLDACPFDDKGVQGSTALPFDLLLQLSWTRRSYTRLVLGRNKLDPGTRTYEPPYVEPLPPEPVLGPSQAAESTAVLAPAEPTEPLQAKPKNEPVLCPEQQELVELAASGRNIFYTGSAGCGKSTVLHAIRTRLKNMGRTVRVMAPTGKVALAINGSTTWTFAGWTPDHHKRKLELLERAARGKTTRKRFRQTDTIIIDEISMVENLHFERLNAVMKVGRSNSLEPFGGVQVIVTGDFCQLPPVKPFQHCITCGSDLVSRAEEEDTVHRCSQCKKIYYDKDKWAFRSEAWKECEFIHVHLKSIHRQNDTQFISMLQKCRLGIPFTQDEVDILMNHRSVTANAVKLFSTRDEVRRTNEEAFHRLKTPPHPYLCFDKFMWDSETHPHLEYKGQRNPDGSLRALDDHRFERRIELKIGMLVVLLVNLDLSSGLCNGSQGIIAGFEPYDPNKLPKKADFGEGDGIVGQHATIKEAHIKEFAEQQRKDNERRGQKLFWPVVRFLNGITKTILPECQVHELGDKQPYSLLCRTQIPLTAAWALSIHKSQGMTLDRVIVDLSRAFEEGQVYVALSRATSLQGLKIEGDPQGLAVGRGGNEQVREFLREKLGM